MISYAGYVEWDCWVDDGTPTLKSEASLLSKLIWMYPNTITLVASSRAFESVDMSAHQYHKW